MRLVIFGTGNNYQKYKDNFRKNIEIIALLDNQPAKWGKKIDGIKVYAPEELKRLKYDAVFILSVYCLEMRMQLIQMGIPKETIYMMDDHIEFLCKKEPLKYYGKWREKLHNNKQEKILVFSHKLHSTGAQNVLYHAICAMRKKNFDVIVISKADGVIRKKLEKQGVPVIIIRDIYSQKNVLEELVGWADIAFVNTLLLYDTVMELSKQNVPLVWWIHETGILKYIEEDFQCIAERKNTAIYAVSPLVKRMIQKEYGRDFHIEVLLCGLPIYEKRKYIGCKSKMVFAVIGYIDNIKGQDLFLNAISRLPEVIRQKAEFWIVGGGKLSVKDQRKIKVQGDCIKILGEIANEKMPEIYSATDVIVCPSRIEAMSVVVAEGCMNEKMSIVSNAAGIAEFIEHGKTGFIFESEDINELAKMMEWAIENPERTKQIGIASKEIYNKYFSMDIFESNLCAILKEKRI